MGNTPLPRVYGRIYITIFKMKTEKAIILSLPFLPVSVNKEYKKFQREVALFFRKLPRYSIEGNKPLEVRYEFTMKVYCKNGNIKKQDLANLEKTLSDTLAHHIDWFKDEKIVKMTLLKINDSKETTNILIKEL